MGGGHGTTVENLQCMIAVGGSDISGGGALKFLRLVHWAGTSQLAGEVVASSSCERTVRAMKSASSDEPVVEVRHGDPRAWSAHDCAKGHRQWVVIDQLLAAEGPCEWSPAALGGHAYCRTSGCSNRCRSALRSWSRLSAALEMRGFTIVEAGGVTRLTVDAARSDVTSATRHRGEEQSCYVSHTSPLAAAARAAAIGRVQIAVVNSLLACWGAPDTRSAGVRTMLSPRSWDSLQRRLRGGNLIIVEKQGVSRLVHSPVAAALLTKSSDSALIWSAAESLGDAVPGHLQRSAPTDLMT